MIEHDVKIPLPGGEPAGDTLDGDDSMTPEQIHAQMMTFVAQIGLQGQQHFSNFGKILDLNYEMDRKLVSLVQAMGAREVTSQAGQTGIPLAGGVAKAA